MAQVPKIYSPTPAQFVAAARGMSASKVASLNTSIEESHASNPTASETEFTLNEDFRRDAGADGTRNQNMSRNSGHIALPTQVFVSLVDQLSGSGANDDDPDVRARRIGGIITRAIKTYETNSKVIHRNPDVTGTELSIRL